MVRALRWLTTILTALLALTANAATPAPPSGVLEADEVRFITANAEFTLMHEMGHLLIHELHLPVLGREEDAADQLGFYGLLLLQDEESDRTLYSKLLDVADYWRLQWQHNQAQGHDDAVWDSHALDQQRFFNLSCLIYGSDPDRLEWVLDVTGLPIERALYCDQEYAQVRHAVDWLMQTLARNQSDAGGQSINVIYEPPQLNIERGPELLLRVKNSRILEDVTHNASQMFRLPRPLTLGVRNCGAPDAWYDRNTGEMTLCWELVSHYANLMPELRKLREQQRLAAHKSP
ncbi:DUF4344 domain-containing metallopeptidase [Atopomonas sediminilitoris]|uniref:DUF4344 domain-containing metallopeptidase n=1 Tax=Atopomonas sediminilitoris TaxID=2919919 RepID=UPI001F4E9535|nr:DUF4344 domain-containing metallopeptidase [Atopomonas sediminilitoris]MCJ8168742.1 DUF4344 domain-containing metallopeptidase [Atopomonas sediminilitoris]